MNTRKVVLGLAIPVALLLGGCGFEGQSATQTSQSATRSAAPLVDFLRQTVSYDYDPLPSPQALRVDADVAGVGTVASVKEDLIQDVGEQTGAVIVTIHLESVWKDHLLMGEDKLVHLVLFRPTNQGAEIFREGLPTGARIAIFGYKFNGVLVGPQPEGPFVEPAPQGLVLDDAGSAVNVWGDENEELPGWNGADTLASLEKMMQTT